MNTVKKRWRQYALSCVAILGASLMLSASASTIDWTTWTSSSYGNATSGGGSATGTSNGVTVSYSGELENFFYNYPSYTPTSTFSGGSVGNAPPSANGIIQLYGGGNPPVTDTITFSKAVINPVVAIWSLGSGGNTASFVFNQTPTIESGGPSAEYGGSSIYIVSGNPNTVLGAEGNGTVQFTGTYKSLSWTNPQYEGWYGFTVGTAGVAPVPEPSSYAMLLAGLSLIGFIAYRRKDNSSDMPMTA